MESNSKAIEGRPSAPCSPSWASLLDHPRHTLRRLGVSFRDQEEMELRLHVVAEDPRYPRLCVNGDLHFGVWLNPRTGDFEGGRGCICASRHDSGCICNLADAGDELRGQLREEQRLHVQTLNERDEVRANLKRP